MDWISNSKRSHPTGFGFDGCLDYEGTFPSNMNLLMNPSMDGPLRGEAWQEEVRS